MAQWKKKLFAASSEVHHACVEVNVAGSNPLMEPDIERLLQHVEQAVIHLRQTANALRMAAQRRKRLCANVKK